MKNNEEEEDNESRRETGNEAQADICHSNLQFQLYKLIKEEKYYIYIYN